MKQNSSTELSGYSFNDIYGQIFPPDLLHPQIAFSTDFPGFSPIEAAFIPAYNQNMFVGSVFSTGCA